MRGRMRKKNRGVRGRDCHHDHHDHLSIISSMLKGNWRLSALLLMSYDSYNETYDSYRIQRKKICIHTMNPIYRWNLGSSCESYDLIHDLSNLWFMQFIQVETTTTKLLMLEIFILFIYYFFVFYAYIFKRLFSD